MLRYVMSHVFLCKLTARRLFLIAIALFCASIALSLWKKHVGAQKARQALQGKPTEVAGPSAFRPLDRAELNDRIGWAIAATSDSKVVYKDVLGEGPGHWDPDPRYPSGEVNCIIWITEVISETYGWGFSDKTAIMDRLRYYGGQIGFGLRKHYLTHWLALEPEPLKRVDLSSCAKGASEKVRIDYGRFLTFHDYPCGLYGMDRASFDVEYVTSKELEVCLDSLPDGYYFMFGAATDEFVRKYGRSSGPIGLVHGVILKLERDSGTSGKVRTVIFHASTVAQKVMEERLDRYAERMKSLHKGYAVYELDPEWDFTRLVKADSAAQSILRCEQGISSSRSRPDF